MSELNPVTSVATRAVRTASAKKANASAAPAESAHAAPAPTVGAVAEPVIPAKSKRETRPERRAREAHEDAIDLAIVDHAMAEVRAGRQRLIGGQELKDRLAAMKKQK